MLWALVGTIGAFVAAGSRFAARQTHESLHPDVKDRPKNNFRFSRPLTRPSPTREEGLAEKLFFGRS
ncbi:MAG TPA: hypothetical protein VIK18_21020 [Pirellulales bacterium]